MMNRPLMVLVALLLTVSSAGAADIAGEANRLAEWSFTSTKPYADPFNEIELDAIFTTPDGKKLRVPAFWAGGQTWKLRYASPVVGKHTFRTVCSDAASSLHGVEGSVEITPYAGDNPLFKHGPIRVAADKRHFEHADGKPFFWLGDTWWMGLTKRLKWPEDVKTLAADRKKKGFTLVQIVAGLYPDMPAFDPRGENEAGFPWEKEYTRIRPEYFDAADERINHLVEQGLMPCIVSTWGFHLPWLGEQRMNKHQRYVYARWGALPMVWCIAGEVTLPFYTNPGFPAGGEVQTAAWEPVIKYARSINGFGRLITAHPSLPHPMSMRRGWKDQTLLDFDMLQTPHGQMEAIAPTVETVRASYDAQPAMPVVNAEPSYEMLFDKTTPEVARAMFWVSWGSGVGGYTYGANGIWQVNRRDRRYGKSPTGGDYGAIAWDEAMHLQGGTQVAHAANLLRRFEFHRFEPHPEWAAYEVEKEQAAPRWGEWIAFDKNAATDAPAVRRRYRKTFDVREDAAITRAIVHLAADDRFTAYVNGRRIGGQTSWETPRRFDIAPLLRPGRNVLAIEAENIPANVAKNPAGLLAAAEVVYDNGKTTSLSSDGTWKATDALGDEPWTTEDFADEQWRAAHVLAKYGDGPWGKFPQQSAVTPPFTSGIPGEVRVIYVPHPKPVRVMDLQRDIAWRGEFFNPATGETTPSPKIGLREDGSCVIAPPVQSVAQDWVVVLKRE